MRFYTQRHKHYCGISLVARAEEWMDVNMVRALFCAPERARRIQGIGSQQRASLTYLKRSLDV